MPKNDNCFKTYIPNDLNQLNHNQNFLNASQFTLGLFSTRRYSHAERNFSLFVSSQAANYNEKCRFARKIASGEKPP